MRPKLFVFLFFVTFFISGCSWIERFVIFNTSDETIKIEYSINHLDGFPIFDQYVDAYGLKNGSNIDWNNSYQMEDLDTSALAFVFELPPNTVLIFGNLHNETYEKYDQHFINDHHFNLEKLKISSSKETVTTTAEGFDQIFTKKNGMIGYTVQ